MPFHEQKLSPGTRNEQKTDGNFQEISSPKKVSIATYAYLFLIFPVHQFIVLQSFKSQDGYLSRYLKRYYF